MSGLQWREETGGEFVKETPRFRLQVHWTGSRVDCEHQERPHWLAIQNDRAGAADAVFATEMSAGQPAVASDRVGQCQARIDDQSVATVVDLESNIVRLCHRLLHHA